MSIVRLLVLGALKRRGAGHGYRVYRDLVEWRVETWTVVRPGSIYHALTQLEAQGLLLPAASTDGQKLGPAKTEYALTDSGHAEFVRLLEGALRDINLIELSVGIAFMEFLPRQRVIALLQERLQAQRQVPEFLATLPTEEPPTTPARHPELIRIWSESYASAASSTERLIQSIESGKYVFDSKKKPAS